MALACPCSYAGEVPSDILALPRSYARRLKASTAELDHSQNIAPAQGLTPAHISEYLSLSKLAFPIHSNTPLSPYGRASHHKHSTISSSVAKHAFRNTSPYAKRISKDWQSSGPSPSQHTRFCPTTCHNLKQCCQTYISEYLSICKADLKGLAEQCPSIS